MDLPPPDDQDKERLLTNEARAGLVQSSDCETSGKGANAVGKRKNWRKPEDMPKRPLSAYNLFFKSQRQRMLGDQAKEYEIADQSKRKHRKTHGKIGFAQMAKNVGQQWKNLDASDRKQYEDEARFQKEAYLEAMKEYKAKKKAEESYQVPKKPPPKAVERDGQEEATMQNVARQHFAHQSSMAQTGVASASRLGAEFNASLPAWAGLWDPLDVSRRRSSATTFYDPSSMALTHLQQQQMQQNFGGSGIIAPPHFQNRLGVDSTREALTAAFSSDFRQPMGPYLLGDIHQQLQQSQQLDAVQTSLNFRLQQQHHQIGQFNRTEDLLRRHLAVRQSMGLGTTALRSHTHGLTGATDPNTAPSLTNMDPRLLEYVLARQHDGPRGGEQPPTGDDVGWTRKSSREK